MSGFSLTAGQSLFGQLIAWSLLPPILSNILLRILISTGIVLPAKSPQQQQTYANRARAAVILLYLGHNILQTVQNAPINHYGLLGLPSGTEATEEEIKRRYRLLARVYHPDKAEFSGDANAANMFMQIRSAVELLSDPDKRAAYDRFGPEVLTWSEAVTLREYMRTGLQQSLVWYAVNQGMYWAVQYLNGSRQNKFWTRLLAMGSFAVELRILISPKNPSPGILRLLLPWSANAFTSYTAVRLLRESYLSLSMAIQQLAMLLPVELSELSGVARQEQEAEQMKVIANNSEQIATIAQLLESHNKGLVRQDLQPFRKAAVFGPDTLPDGAQKAAIRASGADSSTAQLPSKMRADWVHLMADELLASRLSRMPPVQEAMKRAESARSNTAAGAVADVQQTPEDQKPPASSEAHESSFKTAISNPQEKAEVVLEKITAIPQDAVTADDWLDIMNDRPLQSMGESSSPAQEPAAL